MVEVGIVFCVFAGVAMILAAASILLFEDNREWITGGCITVNAHYYTCPPTC